MSLSPSLVLQVHLCWFSISGEVPSSERMQQWFLAKILEDVNVGHDARETDFPTVRGKNGPSLRNRNAIHRGHLLQHAEDLIMVIFLPASTACLGKGHSN